MTKKPNPKDVAFWPKFEEYMKEEARQLEERQRTENLELDAILRNLRKKVPDTLVEKLKQQIRNSIPPQAQDKTIIEVETEAELESVLVHYARGILEERKRMAYKQHNFASALNVQYSTHELLERQAENLQELIKSRDNAISRCSEVNCHLNPEALIWLNSTIETWNSLSMELVKMDVNLGFFEGLPQARGEREMWIRSLLNGSSFTDEELQEQRRLIAFYISNLKDIPITKSPC